MMLPDLIRLIESDGWCRVRMRGSHRQYVHPQKRGVLTIRRQPADELSPGAVHSIHLQAEVRP